MREGYGCSPIQLKEWCDACVSGLGEEMAGAIENVCVVYAGKEQ